MSSCRADAVDRLLIAFKTTSFFGVMCRANQIYVEWGLMGIYNFPSTRRTVANWRLLQISIIGIYGSLAYP